MDHDYEFEIPLASHAKVRVGYSGHPVDRYAAVLLVRDGDTWREARVFDNHLGSHHMHRYTRSGGKQEAEGFHPGPTTKALPAAIEHLKAHWRAIAEAWKT